MDILHDVLAPAHESGRLIACVAVEVIGPDTLTMHCYGQIHEIRNACKRWLADNPEPSVVYELGGGDRVN